MTEWWERAYPGAPMVGPALIRPLYPPDANTRGKKPSEDGLDVKAIKRALWRGGRWEGPASAFDDTYSNNFAHGKGPNVIDSGMAGFQRQMKIDDSGWMGEGTYNAIRSALIPDGLPNEGEHLLDATAIEMLEDFQKAYTNTYVDSVRTAALSRAKTYLGYKESPPETNGNMFGSWYGMNYQPWCAMFVTYCFEQAGPSPSFQKGSRYHYCPTVVDDARNKRNGLSTTTTPIPGDLCVYDWGRDGVFDHIGIFEDGTSFSWTAIEGNTSTSNNSNGGQVMRRTRAAGDANVVFVRVKE